MTDKQIMIDNVDVSGCTYSKIGRDKKCYCEQDLYDDGEPVYTCDECTDCYYKQLKRKEQECEELKDELILKDVVNIELSDEVKKYRKAIDEIEEIADNNYENPEMERIFKIIGGLDV